MKIIIGLLPRQRAIGEIVTAAFASQYNDFDGVVDYQRVSVNGWQFPDQQTSWSDSLMMSSGGRTINYPRLGELEELMGKSLEAKGSLKYGLRLKHAEIVFRREYEQPEVCWGTRLYLPAPGDQFMNERGRKTNDSFIRVDCQEKGTYVKHFSLSEDGWLRPFSIAWAIAHAKKDIRIEPDVYSSKIKDEALYQAVKRGEPNEHHSAQRQCLYISDELHKCVASLGKVEDLCLDAGKRSPIFQTTDSIHSQSWEKRRHLLRYAWALTSFRILNPMDYWELTDSQGNKTLTGLLDEFFKTEKQAA